MLRRLISISGCGKCCETAKGQIPACACLKVKKEAPSVKGHKVVFFCERLSITCTCPYV